MKKYCTYNQAKKWLTDKDKAVNSYIEYMLAKTNEMFKYEGLPETIPARNLEHQLQVKGYSYITKANDGKLYAFTGGYGGKPNVYNEPSEIIIANPALNFNKTCNIEKDGVLIRNDSRRLGLIPLLSKFGVMLTDCEISLNLVSVLMRMLYTISACDDKSKSSADIFMQKIINGDFSVIGESAFFDGVKVQSASGSNSSNVINQFIELTQYIRATAFNEIGLNANYNMKRERLSENEIELNNDAIIPYAQNMENSRKEGVKMLNKMYGLDVKVSLSSVWRAEKEQMEQFTKSVDTDLDVGGETTDKRTDKKNVVTGDK